MSFAERYRRLSNRRGQDGWSIVFGYPVGRALLVLLEPWQALRPTHITLFGILVKLVGAALLLSAAPARVLLGAVLLQVAQVFDSMDGTLARARGQTSASGAFLDKVGDSVALLAIGAVVGLRAAEARGEPLYALAGLGGASLHLLRCYMYWVTRGLATQAAWERVDGANVDATRPSLFREWLLGWPRLLMFGEADLYLWVAVGAVAGLWVETSLALLASQGLAAAGLAVHHLLRLRPRGSS